MGIHLLVVVKHVPDQLLALILAQQTKMLVNAAVEPTSVVWVEAALVVLSSTAYTLVVLKLVVYTSIAYVLNVDLLAVTQYQPTG